MAGRSRGTVVCADEERCVRELLEQSLSAAGYRCLVAADGQTALRLIADERADLVIADLQLPPEGGMMFYRRVRELSGHKHTPIVFLSRSTAQEDVVLALQLGAADYVSKPFAVSVLRGKLEVILASRGERVPAADASLVAAPAEVQWAATNPDALFDKYVLLDEIGHGAMGRVRRAWDTTLETYVALKFLVGRFGDTPIERLYREARTVAGLSHPNICRVYDIRQVEGRHYISMQLIEGEPSDRKFEPELAAMMMVEVAGAIGYAHQQGVIHRDIKPLNVLVDGSGKPWVMDFGLAKTLTEETLTPDGMVVGTPGFMSPEQAGYGGPVTHLSDIYALGATLYVWLTGTPPFEGDRTSVLLAAVGSSEVTPPSKLADDVPPGLERICLGAMARDPHERPRSAAALIEQLEGWLAKRTTRKARSSWWGRGG